jgi:hypothetical protein
MQGHIVKLIVTNNAISSNLSRLLKDYPHVSFAVAWASANTDIFEKLSRRRTFGSRHFLEIEIRGNDRKAVGLSEFPNGRVWCLQEARRAYVDRPRKKIVYPSWQAAREILVKQELHRAIRRPIRAAKSKTAGKSSGSSSG